MKLSDRSRFPRPVLWIQSGDYVRGAFSVAFDGTESLTTGALALNYSVVLDEPTIFAMLASKKAAAGVFVTCLETYYNKLVPIALPAGRFDVPAGYLRGRVILRPVVWSVESADLGPSECIHPEFDNRHYEIPKSGLIAIADEEVIEVGREKLARVESIFSIAVNDDVPENQIALQLDDEKIQILAARSTYEKIHRLRGTLSSQAILLNSIYLPAVMDVLSCLRDAPGDYDGRRWHRVFMAKLRYLDLNVESDDLLECAQFILNSPFTAIPDNLEIRAL